MSSTVDVLREVHCFEDHHRAYDLWEQAGFKHRTLVHFDGHLDFYWIPDQPPQDVFLTQPARPLSEWIEATEAWNLGQTPMHELMTIGNFLYPAIRKGIVNRLYWVVPDPFWASPSARRQVRHSLESMLKGHPVEMASLKETDASITLTLLGCPVTVCPLRRLPAFHKPVLLDIDTDYLVTSKCDYEPVYFSEKPVVPWQTPEVLLERLARTRLSADFVTVAYSVNGGYTPLAYKFYGDRIAEGLMMPAAPHGAEPDADTAAAAYWKMLQAVERKNVEEAAQAWRETIRRDPSYRTLYALPAYREEMARRWMRALAFYDMWVIMDSSWYYPHLGRGRALWHLGLFAQAEAALRTACERTAGPTMAWYWLGQCAFRREDWKEARQCAAKALTFFPYEPTLWWAAARAAEKQREFRDASKALDQCLSLGYHPPELDALAKRLKPSRVIKKKGPSMNPQNLQVIYQRKSGMVTRRVAGEIILVPIQPRLTQEPALFTLDGVAAFLWEQLEKATSGQALSMDLQAHYAVDAAQADRDVAAFLLELTQIDAIEPCPALALGA